MAPNIVRPYGDQALLIQYESTAEVLAAADAVRAGHLPGVLDIVPGARTVLIEFDNASNLVSGRRFIDGMPPAIVQADRTDDYVNENIVNIDVTYDGADLADVAELTGLGIDEVIEAHTARKWRVGFGGFAPGFAYLVDGDPRLQVPRRPEPRTRVPAGSVALAGEFSGIYPRESPGGWQLIGHSDAPLWDIARPQPALLTPGIWVQFRAQ